MERVINDVYLLAVHMNMALCKPRECMVFKPTQITFGIFSCYCVHIAIDHINYINWIGNCSCELYIIHVHVYPCSHSVL